MADYGIKISLPGKDVLSVGLKDLIFHSKYPMLKIKTSGSGSLSFTDGGAGFDVLLLTHSLGYKPMFYLLSTYYDSLSNAMVTSYERMPFRARSAGGVIQLNYFPSVSTTEFRYSGSTMGGDGASHTINYYWFLYYEPE